MIIIYWYLPNRGNLVASDTDFLLKEVCPNHIKLITHICIASSLISFSKEGYFVKSYFYKRYPVYLELGLMFHMTYNFLRIFVFPEEK